MQRLSLIVRALLLISLSGGLFLVACNPGAQKAIRVVNLNTSEMIEADGHIVDSVMGASVLSVYLCKALPEVKDDAAPCADVYVCKSFKRDSVLGDTVIIIDTHLRNEISGNPDIYWTGIKKTKR
ncbi:hypothetical protein ACEN9X_06185 [Mucilaginibacter sp. Mucisp86]|uniref:hypothetical protein n=1 Tax=Mucilaginibacter sp. Mucisp86 TaxID=3243060 RepID=UPI0039B63A6E